MFLCITLNRLRPPVNQQNPVLLQQVPLPYGEQFSVSQYQQARRQEQCQNRRKR